MNEKEIIDCVNASVGVLSNETLITQHPWVDDPLAELKRVKAEEQEELDKMSEYQGAFQSKEARSKNFEKTS